jgi:hypothetical protein
MPDTARTRAALLELFADNTRGNISAQDLRDFVVSVTLDASSRYSITFTNSDLASGVLAVEHGLGRKLVQVSVYDENDYQIMPQEVMLEDDNNLSVSLQSFGTISGIWSLVVI